MEKHQIPKNGLAKVFTGLAFCGLLVFLVLDPQFAFLANFEQASGIPNSIGGSDNINKINGDPEDLFEGVLRSGSGWSMWDRQSIRAHSHVDCQWTDFVPWRNRNGVPRMKRNATAQMCTYSKQEDEFVSAQIRNIGHWRDCDALVNMWENSPSKNHPTKDNDDEDGGYFLEIGVNIGACLMEMLLSTNARIIGFEAHPKNAQQVMTTLRAQPKEVRERVAFFPIGIGSEAGEAAIYSEQNNKGHSVVNNKQHGDLDGEGIDATPTSIVLERLDAILPAFEDGTKRFRLIKMDVEGFECRVMDSGRGIFANAGALKTEAAVRWLEGQNCSVDELYGKIADSGFSVIKPPHTKEIYDISVTKT